MIEESKCCSDVMKKHFDKELLMTKEDNENFKNSTKSRRVNYEWFSNRCNRNRFFSDVK